jgi:hypothetical protein
VGLNEEQATASAKAKTNAGVLRCAQNDKFLEVGLEEDRQLQVQ